MMDPLPEMPVVDDRPIWDVWFSSVWLPAVLAADELGVFDALGREPATPAELAGRLDLNEDALVSLLALLSSLGLLTRRLGRFGPAAAGQVYLRRERPLFWGEALGVMGHPPTVSLLCQCLRDKAPRGHYQAARQWAGGEASEEAAAAVARVMQSQSLPAALGLASHESFRDARRLLDVGGGSGCFSIALARRHPDLRCTVMELPAMCPVVSRYVAQAGLQGRIDVRAADMFKDPWPAGHDAVLFSNVFHDWAGHANSRLAEQAFAALDPKGSLMVHEMLLADGLDGPLASASFSVMMLLAVGGRQYTARELAAIAEGAGFCRIRVSPAYGYYSLMTATKP